MKINEIKLNPNNPRIINEEKFEKLKKSIKDFPQMLELRPLVLDENNMVLGGNMRLRALQELGIEDVKVVYAKDLTEEQKKEFIIKDNLSYGNWDWDILANEWDSSKLENWGLDVEKQMGVDIDDLFKIELPFYKPSIICPQIEELSNLEISKNLKEEIRNLKCPEKLKDILIERASFFTDFNFQKIADYYYNSDDEIKSIFKKLGLVILAPEEALKYGFIELAENIENL